MIILDASALVKLVVKEEGSARAIMEVNRAIQHGELVASPDLALAESLNAIWKHVKMLKDMGENEASSSVEKLLFVWQRITHLGTDELAHNAIKIALENNMPAYDSLYIAASRAHDSPLFTFDGGIIGNADKLGIRLL
ncbi:MAG: type II toxin-antitoxin system VapC family toxin [Candidatus Micrarchaeaceae archaeon]